MELNIEKMSSFLKSHDIRPSYQRMKIFEYLVVNKNHPTIDMIYKSLAPKIPTLSKTTVYNTLNLFIEKKIAIVILVEENETRYDADTSIHGHFKCEECGTVKDLNLGMEKIDIPELTEFQINEHHLYFKGVCKECLESNK
ncbi:MAG: transcriptional repressor [Fusobacteria bacterium]|nr:MAG: transcriptional repressor [Fusobacteriota bacterium]